MKLVYIGDNRGSSTKSIPLNEITDPHGIAFKLPLDPEKDLVVDPRPVLYDRLGLTFDVKLQQDNATRLVLMITRTDKNKGWPSLLFRVYDRTKEDVPSFDSSLPYEYWGLDKERAPYDATVVKVHREVTTIKRYAFDGCKKMTTCDMSDAPVEGIKEYAFSGCTSLQKVIFSNRLEEIGHGAFQECSALDCLIIPPTVINIYLHAFRECTSMRIIKLPSSINLDHVYTHNYIIDGCTALLAKVPDNEEPKQWLKDRYDQYPLHNTCYNAHVTIEEIKQCIQDHPNAAHLTDEFGMTALHMITIMACTSNLQSANGNANDTITPEGTGALIMACFRANMSAAFMQDDRGKTPLDYLLECSNGLDVHNSMVAPLCVQWTEAQSEVGASSSSAAAASQQHQHESFKRMRYH